MKKHVVLTSVASLLTLASVAVLPAFAQDTGGMRRMENPSWSGQNSEGSSRQRGQQMRWGKGEQRDHNTYGYGSSGKGEQRDHNPYRWGKGEQRDHNTYRWGKGDKRDHDNYRYGSSGSGYGYDRSGKGNYGYSSGYGSGYGYGSPRMSR
jgi:hypothetical protein